MLRRSFGIDTGMPRFMTLLAFALTISLPQVTLAQSRVSGGDNFTLLVTDSGTVWSFGKNSSGQLGLGHTTDARSPQQVQGLSPVALSLGNVVAIAAGQRHSLALTASGDLYSFGYNYFGQLGTGDTVDRNVPVLILSGVSAIGAGDDHSLAVKTDTTAWAWGRNGGGQLGNSVAVSGATPAPVQMIGVTNAAAVSGGYAHSVIRLSDGTV